MEKVKLQINYNKSNNNFVLNIKRKLKEDIYYFDNENQVKEFVQQKTGIKIKYDYYNDKFLIPFENQIEI